MKEPRNKTAQIQTDEEARKLLVENMGRVAVVSREIDPLHAAYIAGRLDGIIDAMTLHRQSA